MNPPEESGAGVRSTLDQAESSKAGRDQIGTPVDNFEVQGESPGENFQGPFKETAESPSDTAMPGGRGTDCCGRLALYMGPEKRRNSEAARSWGNLKRICDERNITARCGGRQK